MRLPILAALLALAAAPAAAQAPPQDAVSAAARGQTDLTYNRSRPTAAPADRTALQAKGVRLRDMILATPALADPRGFALHASVVLEHPVSTRPADPDTVWGVVLSRRINVARSKPDAAGRYPGDGEGPTLTFAINRLVTAFSYVDEDGVFTLPEQRQEADGAMRFTHAGRAYLVVTPPGLKVYKPVSIEEYLTAQARGMEKDAPEFAAPLRAALAPLSAAERAAPYCKTSAPIEKDVTQRCRQPRAQPVVRWNPALAAGTGPATKARMIVLAALLPSKIGDPREQQRLHTAFDQLDLAALQGLLRD